MSKNWNVKLFLHTIRCSQSFSNVITALDTILYWIRGLQSILNVFLLLKADFSESEKCRKWSNVHFHPKLLFQLLSFFHHSFVFYLNADFSESEKCRKWSKTIFFFMSRSRYFKMVKCWNFIIFQKTTVFLIKICHTFIFRNCDLREGF